MSQIEMEQIQAKARSLGFDYAKPSSAWNGYEVYGLCFRTPRNVGLPYVLLAKDGKIRVSTPDEAMEYLHYCSLLDGDEEQ